MRNVLTWYYRGGMEKLNFGEHLVDVLLAEFGCVPTPFTGPAEIDPEDSCLMMIGSEFTEPMVAGILKQVSHIHIWGQGCGRGEDMAVDMRKPEWRDCITIHALRGPLTKRICHVEDDVPLLDPGFLLGKYPILFSEHREGVVYVPHETNRDKVGIEHTEILDVICDGPGFLDLFNCLISAEFVLANAMHVFIACIACGVPCAICLTGDEELNMPDKWKDMLGSLDYDEPVPVVSSLDEGWKWWDSEGKYLIVPDTKPLVDAFPFAQ